MTWQQTIDEEKDIAYEEGHDAGRAEGIAEGARETAIANAKNLLAEGDSPEKVARCCFLPLGEVLALKEELAGQTVAQA